MFSFVSSVSDYGGLVELGYIESQSNTACFGGFETFGQLSCVF